MSFWAIFSLWTSQQPKKSKFWRNKKKPGDIIILHFCTTNDDHMRNGSWDIKHDREFFVISDYFLPFYPPNNPENQNFEKMKKTPVGIIISNTSNINEIWYLRYEPELPFTPITVQKLKISKKWKKSRDISSFYTSVPKIMIICYTFPEIWQVTDVIVTFHLLGYFLPFYPPNSPKNKKIPKKWKETLEISSFYTSVPKIMIISYTVPEIRCMADIIVIFHFRLFFALLHPLPH